MRLVVYAAGGTAQVGMLSEDGETVQRLDLAGDLDRVGVVAAIEADRMGKALKPVGDPIPLAGVKLLPPVPRPARNIFCVGKNYYEHAHEFSGSGFDSSAAAGAVPKDPIIFSKVPESVIGPGDAIVIDADVSTAIDYEVELAVIIGKAGRNIAREIAFDHVWGYTIINDVTARDIQGRHSQWLLGKSQDTFCPMGPLAVTHDALDAANIKVTTHLNGELRQDTNTRDLIFDIPACIEACSNGITLYPGDIIATGTPAGVGIGFKPPKYMVPGDVVRLEIEGIGVLENPVKAIGT